MTQGGTRLIAPCLPGSALLLICLLCCLSPATSAETNTGSAATSPTSLADAYGILTLADISHVSDPLLTEPQDSRRTVKRLSLRECIQRTLAHNLEVRVAAHDPAIRMSDVVEAEAAFDAEIFATMQFDNTDQDRLDSEFTTAQIETGAGSQTSVGTVKIPTNPYLRSHDYNYGVGIRKRLPTGAVIELAETLRRFRTLTEDGALLYRNPFYEYGAQVQLRQPLLRDFGIDVNRAAILAARNNYRISQQQFQLLLIQTVAEVETNYWRMVFARTQMKIFENLRRSAEETLQRVLLRSEYDGSSLAAARARTEVARATANWTKARSAVIQRQDLLLESINDPELPVEKRWEIIPADPLTEEAFQLDYADALRTGMKMRPELAAQKLRIDTAGLAKGVAENQKLPRLDVSAVQQITGAGAGAETAWDEQWRGDRITSSVALSFEFPVGNRAREAAYGRTRRELEQVKLQLASIEEQVRTDVSVALNKLNNTYREIAARRRAVQADMGEVISYRAIQNTERQDSVTPQFLNLKLNADRRLAESQLTAMQTIIEYNLAIMDIHRAQGVLLRYDNIKLAETLPA